MFKAIIYSFTGCSMGNGAVTGAGNAVNGDTTSPSAKARMIQLVGVHLSERIPPEVGQDGGCLTLKEMKRMVYVGGLYVLDYFI